MAPLIQKRLKMRLQRGQALVEYALILALLAIAMAVALAATGPAIADVFSNVICNVAGQEPCGSEVADLSPVGDPSAFWQTVTWVASSPRGETPYPTPPERPPTLAPTIGGPSNTNTPVPTRTPVPTFTVGPSHTPADRAFYLTYDEHVELDPNSKANWRLDSGVYLGGDAWVGYYYQNTSFSGAPTIVSNVSIPGADPLGIAFNWGTGLPITKDGWTASDNFSVNWVRRIDVPVGGVSVRFDISADDRASLYLCPTEADAIALSGCDQIFNNTASATQTRDLVEGSQWLTLRYVENSGDARVSLNIGQIGGVNPDDIVAGGGECAWGIKTNSDSNTLDSMFDENPNSDAWPGGQVCYLELRGWVDTTGAARPVLSFWDVWDLPAGVNAALQVADYTADHTALAWRTIPLRTGGANVRNYEWTRSEVALANVTPGLTSNRLAMRFVLSSAGQAGTFDPARWYIDDIRVKDTPETVFTVGQSWALNSSSQKADFITTGRWDITTTLNHGGMSFEDSPNRDYDLHSQGSPRVHYIELANPVDVTTAVAPATDSEGDAGSPMLSFWHAFDIAPGTQLQVQYTVDPRDTVPDVWQTIPVGTGSPAAPGGLLYDNTGSADVPSLVMRPVEIMLDQIPTWNTQPFRLRFALIAGGSTTSDGWWIDDIKIERDGGAKFTAYPFIDGAESDDFTEKNWIRLGSWAAQFGAGVRENGFQTGRAYADSVNANAITNVSTAMEMKRYIDLFYDTPANTSDPGGVGEALTGTVAERQTINRPMLTFWHRRDVRAGTTFAVDMTTTDLEDTDPTTDLEWHQIWVYTAPNSNPSNSISRWQENAWERVEIDLSRALLTTTGADLNTLRTGGTNTDDDFRIRIRLVSGNSTGDGLLIDWIQIKELPELVHKLWDGTVATYGAGNGALIEDYVETVFPTSLPSVRERWYVDVGEWTMMQETPSNGDIARSGSFSFHDSPQPDESSLNYYLQDAYVILELRTIIDLRGTNVSLNPTLYYWQRYYVHSSDRFRVQISVEDATQTASQHDRIPGWAAWQDQNPLPYTEMGGSTIGSIGWEQQMLSLNSFVGKRIKLRWVINSMNSSNSNDGWYLDNIRFAYNGNGAGATTPISLPFFDDAQSTNNWITEGTWGLAADHFRSSLGDTGGPTLWRGYWFKCGTAPDGNQLSSEGCSFNGMRATVQRSWPAPGAGVTTLPPLGPYTGPLPPSEDVSSIYTLLDIYTPGETPLDGTLGSDYADNVGARYMRVVTFSPGLYTFQVSHDDGTRIWINDRTDTSVTSTSNNIYYNSGWMSRDTLQTTYLAINTAGPTTRIIGVDYQQGGGPGHLYVNLGRNSYSFTDSPNAQSGYTYVMTKYLQPAKTSMILNGYFDLSGLTDPTLQFYYIGDLRNSARLYAEFSSDGGFTWTSLWNWGNTSSWAPDWNRATVRFATNGTFNGLSAAQKSHIMIRFRLNSGTGNRDGVYLAEIALEEP